MNPIFCDQALFIMKILVTGGTGFIGSNLVLQLIEDGHEVLFQQPAARRQLRCFLETLALERPRLVRPDASRSGCEPPR